MRLPLLVLLGCLCAGAYADPAPAPVPPPPAMDSSDASDEPQVTITQEKEQTVEEYRVGGRLFMIKITPKSAPPYYLVDDDGDGKFTRHDTVDSNIRAPRWILFKF
jgi:hypothetical protein